MRNQQVKYDLIEWHVILFSQVLIVFSFWASTDNINAHKPREGEEGLTSSLNEKTPYLQQNQGNSGFTLLQSLKQGQ